VREILQNSIPKLSICFLVRLIPIWYAMAIAEVPDVQIDDSGVFKYILIRAEDKDKQSKDLVRGFASAEYHADILEKVEKQLLPKKIKLECLG
jgi:Janus/Ocnus family (Ocnus)